MDWPEGDKKNEDQLTSASTSVSVRFADDAVAGGSADDAGNARERKSAKLYNSESSRGSVQSAASAVQSKQPPGAGAGSSYFVATTAETLHSDLSCEMKVRKIMDSDLVEGCLAMVIFFNFLLICVDTDARADTAETMDAANGDWSASSGTAPLWVDICINTCFAIYLIEFLVRLAAWRREIFHNVWNRFDAFVVGTGLVEYLLQITGQGLDGSTMIRIVRLCRLLRLIRVMRLFVLLKELRKLLLMMGSCFKTLFWSFLLLILSMTIWATIAVEVVNPMVLILASRGVWAEVDCTRCHRAFASVFNANVTFFQTIVAGDSWGKIAVPVIEEWPVSGLIFAGSQLTLVFGVLNLIIAVIVDTFAEARSKDVVARAEEMQTEELQEKKVLNKIFDKLDTDGSQSVDFDELQEGAGRVAELSHWLRVLDVDAKDFPQIFEIVDTDASGTIERHEFVEGLYRLKNADAKTGTRLVKHVTTQLLQKQADLETNFAEAFVRQSVCLDEMRKNTHENLERITEDMALKIRAQEEGIRRSISEILKEATEAATEAVCTQLVPKRNSLRTSRFSMASSTSSTEADGARSLSHIPGPGEPMQLGVDLPVGEPTLRPCTFQQDRPPNGLPKGSRQPSPSLGSRSGGSSPRSPSPNGHKSSASGTASRRGASPGGGKAWISRLPALNGSAADVPCYELRAGAGCSSSAPLKKSDACRAAVAADEYPASDRVHVAVQL